MAKKDIVSTKSKRSRRVPMNDAVYEATKHLALSGQDKRVVELNLNKAVVEKFKPMCEQAGVTVIRWHDLRHTFASQLAMSGEPLRKIQKLLGHSSVTTTERYSHLEPAALERSTDILCNGFVPKLFSRENGKVVND